MQCLVTSNSLWQAVPSKPLPEHTYPSSHHCTSVWCPTFWVLWNTAQKEIAMCSRWYPDVMLCGSMNLPPMLCNPDWPLWRNTKRTMEIRNAVCQFMGNALTALFLGVHSKTPGSLNAVGRIQDTVPIVMGWLESVWPTLPSFSQRSSKTCYQNHFNEVQKQTVSFWQNWLAPIPIWLNNVVLMQQIEVHKEGLQDIEFDCSAI